MKICTVFFILFSILIPFNVVSAYSFSDAWDDVKDAASDAVDHVEDSTEFITEVSKTPFDIVGEVMEGSVDISTELIKGNFDEAFKEVMNTIKGIMSQSMEPIQGIFDSSLAPSPAEALGILGIAGGASLIAGAEESGAATDEEGASVQQYYGGKILLTLPCGCEGGATSMIWLYDFKTKLPMLLKYIPIQSRLYLNRNIWTSGNAILGSYTSGGSCVVYVGVYCVSIPTYGTLDSLPGTGTSLYSAFK